MSITANDLYNFFSNDKWLTSISGKEFVAKSDDFIVSITTDSTSYKTEVRAIEDKLDFSRGITGDPIHFIKQFIGLSVHIASKNNISNRLKKLAFSDDKRNSLFVLRRMFAGITLSKTKIGYDNFGMLDKMIEDIKDNGWDILSSDATSINVSIFDEFLAGIELNMVDYKYSFEVSGFPETKEERIVQDPIESFLIFQSSKKTKTALYNKSAFESFDDFGSVSFEKEQMTDPSALNVASAV